MIEIRDIHKSFNKNKVLKGINFNIIRGESAVIIGRSGTGKSVLLKCILGLINADEGNVILNGEELYNKKMNYISQKKTKIGRVPTYHIPPNRVTCSCRTADSGMARGGLA